jgi:hypothetical protein
MDVMPNAALMEQVLTDLLPELQKKTTIVASGSFAWRKAAEEAPLSVSRAPYPLADARLSWSFARHSAA